MRLTKLLTAAVIAACALCASAQTPQYCPTTGCTYSGNISTPTVNLGPKTIGSGPNQLPAAAAGNNGWVTTVTDAANAGDCTTGGGSVVALCRSNGTIWKSLGGGGLISVQAQTGPAVTFSGDGYVLPGTASANNIPLSHAKLDQLDTPNTHLIGNQVIQTGSTSNVGLILQGVGTGSATVVYANSGNVVSGAAFTTTVAVNQVLYLFIRTDGSSVPANTSLGNVWVRDGTDANAGGGLFFGTFHSVITHAGSDSINVLASGIWSAVLLQGLYTAAPTDSNVNAWHSGLSNLNLSLTQNNSNDVLIFIGSSDQSGVTPTGCTAALPTGYTLGFSLTASGGGPAMVNGYESSTTTGTQSATISTTCTGGTNLTGALIAAKVASTFSQTADFAQVKDGNGNITGRWDANGGFGPPQNSGTPGFIPTNYGEVAFNTAASGLGFKNPMLYDLTLGWVPSVEGPSTQPTATSDVACYADISGGKLKDCGPQIGGGKTISYGRLGATSCTTGSSTYSTCDNTITISPAQADTAYTCTFGGASPSDARAAIQSAVAATTTTATVRIVTEGSVAITYGDLSVACIHN